TWMWKGFLMKHARCWLLMVVALWLLPSAAFAQPKKPAGGGKPPPTAPAPAPAGGDIEIDDPNVPKPADTPPPTDTPAPTGGDTGAAGGGICEIDPTACPKQGDIKKLA